ncbi:MAG: YraN family protein [Bacteroidaceae bacterium]
MAQHNELGKVGEEAAAKYLLLHGYEIRSLDWHCGHKDIDIVAEKPGLLVVVEVKTRSNECFGNAVDAVDNQKIRNLVSAADAYMRYYKLDTPVRFDIITVIGTEPPFEIIHIEEAFTSPLWSSTSFF